MIRFSEIRSKNSKIVCTVRSFILEEPNFPNGKKGLTIVNLKFKKMFFVKAGTLEHKSRKMIVEIKSMKIQESR